MKKFDWTKGKKLQPLNNNCCIIQLKSGEYRIAFQSFGTWTDKIIRDIEYSDDEVQKWCYYHAPDILDLVSESIKQLDTEDNSLQH